MNLQLTEGQLNLLRVELEKLRDKVKTPESMIGWEYGDTVDRVEYLQIILQETKIWI